MSTISKSYPKGRSGDMTQKKGFILKDPGSAITHFIGFVAAVIGMIPLLIIVSTQTTAGAVAPIVVFLISLCLLYGASTTYHSLDISKTSNHILQKIDHMMVYVLIAGTYTPICKLVLDQKTGSLLLIVIWGIAIAGITQAALWSHCPKWVSAILYIAMGWACVAVFPKLLSQMPRTAFIWLFAGGALYTAGGILYALKLSIFNTKHKNFGQHEIFHLFCLGGSVCHYVMMFYII